MKESTVTIPLEEFKRMENEISEMNSGKIKVFVNTTGYNRLGHYFFMTENQINETLINENKDFYEKYKEIKKELDDLKIINNLIKAADPFDPYKKSIFYKLYKFFNRGA